MIATVKQPYACTARTHHAGRCRNLSVVGTCRCTGHPLGDFENVAPPDEVLYKFNINPKWVERLTREGVEIRYPNFENRIAAHIAQAEEVGRGAFTQRDGIEDSGSPVFGEGGLTEVDVFQLFRELLDAFNIVDVSIEPMRAGKNQAMKKLVVYFSNGAPRVKNTLAINSLLEFLAVAADRDQQSSGSWGHAHIWDNPPKKNGLFRSTVNISHRQPEKRATQVVHYNNGLWSVEPIEEKVAS